MGRTSYFDAHAGNLRGLSLTLFYTSIDISLKDKYLYCPTPKVARFSMLIALHRFCFVRNPFDRIISAYLNKVVVEKSLVPRLAAALNKSDEQFTFEEFLDVVSAENLAEMDLHYAPQSRVTFQGFVNYDFIGKYENLQSDLERVYEIIGCDAARFGVVVNPHYTGEKDYAKYLTPRNCEIIKKMYQEDFERFQYREIPPQ